ncbi:MAG: SPFH domain-containing protein [Anaerolineae bacterium]
MLLRFLVLVGYVAAFITLRTYVRDHPPRFEGEYVYESERLKHALVRMFGLLLWPLPGLLWIGMMRFPTWIVGMSEVEARSAGMLPLPAVIIIILSLLIPLDIFLIFFTVVGVLKPQTNSPVSKLFSWLPAIFSVFFTLLVLLTLPRYTFSFWQFMVFLAFVTVPPLLAVCFLVWVASCIVPTSPDQPKRLWHIARYFTGFFTTFPKPSWMVEDGEAKMRIKGNAFYGVGPGWLMTEPENLVVLKDGTKIKRIVGPGVLFTEPAESPHQVIDLRNQIRITRVNARTQDGIEVNLPISSLFRVAPGPKPISLESLANQEPWPYRNKRDIYKIVFHEEVDPTGKTPLEAHQVRLWDDIPLKAAINRVKQVIPEYSLEQLYSITPGTIDPKTGKIIPETGVLTRPMIAARVRETVKATVEPLGFEILGGGIGNKIVPTNPEVVKQRVEAWKASFISKVMDWQTEAQVQSLKDLSRIRSDARVELLTEILQQTAMKLEDRENASRYLAHHLLENLLHLARNSQVRELLPETALPTLAKFQELTKGD